jgi:hypothetical protein
MRLNWNVVSLRIIGILRINASSRVNVVSAIARLLTVRVLVRPNCWSTKGYFKHWFMLAYLREWRVNWLGYRAASWQNCIRFLNPIDPVTFEYGCEKGWLANPKRSAGNRHFQFLFWYSETNCAVKSYKATEWVRRQIFFTRGNQVQCELPGRLIILQLVTLVLSCPELGDPGFRPRARGHWRGRVSLVD